MQTHKPMALGLSTRCIEHRRRLGLCITAALYFPFVEDGPVALWTEASMWTFLAKEMPEGPMLDEGVLKTVPEYLLRARAYPPKPPAALCAVRARVGTKEKTLLVSGDRHWIDRERASAPVPFAEMPFDWSRAYGGPGFAANPAGRGHAPGPDGVHVLPNVEWPEEALLRRDQTVLRPAGFGMLDPLWPQRAQYRGTYDEEWFRNHSPGFAPDVDWKYFNLAPADQWFEAALAGDESFEFQHLHPTRAIVRGRLPGMRVRCFLERAGAGGPTLREVAMHLRTLWFFPHAERGVLLFHGLAQVGDEHAADVLQLMGAIERAGEPKPDAHYLQVLEQRKDPRQGALHALRDSDLLPANLAGKDPEFEATQNDYQTGDLLAQAQFRHAEVQVEKLRLQVRAQGMDPDALQVRMPPREPVPTLEELPRYLEQATAKALQEQKAAIARALQQREQAMALVKEAGIDPKTLVHRGPPTYSAQAHLQQLRQAVAGTPQAGVLKTVAPKLVLAEQAARDGYRLAAHLQEPAPPLPPPVAGELKQQAREAQAAGLQFAGGNFTGGDFTGMDLHGADFREAWLESADFSGADLSGANLSRAVLAHANLSGAVLRGADLRGSNLGRAQVAGAVFDEARLDEAMLMYTALARTSLRGSVLVRANLLEATWGEADWSGCDASDQNFLRCNWTAMVLAGAKLQRASFIECDLSGADLRGADLTGASFIACKLAGTRLAGARLEQALFVQACDLSGADCSGAAMAGAQLRGAVLRGANLTGARLEGADLSEADLDGCVLADASLRGALVIQARLTRAQAPRASLMDAILQRADLSGTDLSAANLFGADLSRARADTDTRFDHALTTRARTYPRFEPPPAP